jgi:CO/xanthine dehydrogenase Mo-binding subunit
MITKIVGKRVERIGVRDKVIGKAKYAADLKVSGTLVLKVYRSPVAHGIIRKIETKKAADLEGVVRIFTAEDIPGENLYGIINKDQIVLAREKVRFVGDPIALIAAEDEERAEQALEALDVEIEELPAVFDPVEALRPDSPAVHEKGNLLFNRRIVKGDVEKGFAEADIIIEETYETHMLEHAYIEPEVGVAYRDEDECIVILVTTQNPHSDHAQLVSILGVEPEKVRVIQTETGGGFGGKLDISVQPFLALAAYYLDRPVRMVYSREESFQATAKRHPLKIRMRTGATRSGKLTAVETEIIADTGAYGSYGIAVATRSAVHATGPYEVPNVFVESKAVYTNNNWSGAMRGFGVPQIAIAHESQMDKLAERLGFDPITFRMMNAFTTGSVTPTGQTLNASVGIRETLKRIRPYYEQLLREAATTQLSGLSGVKYGVGVGSMWYGIGNTGHPNPSSAQIEVDHEGNVTLYTGAADIGQGSDTVLVQIAAETLGLNYGQIQLVRADTTLTTDAGATSASRQTYISGRAVYEAALDVRKRLTEKAAKIFKVPESLMVCGEDSFFPQYREFQKLSFMDVVKRSLKPGDVIHGEGYFNPETTGLDSETGQGIPYTTYAFASQVSLVEVDLVTGQVSVVKTVSAHDVGKAVNPTNVEGQIYSGVAMGIGMGLFEQFYPGKTKSLDTYLIPTAMDVPEIEPVIVEVPEPTGPFGAKGVGEPALIPTAPAILNAIHHATGWWVNRIPADLETIRGLIPANEMEKSEA